MSAELGFNDYVSGITTGFPVELGTSGGYLTLSNSGIRGTVKSFQASLESMLQTFKDILINIQVFKNINVYVEGDWRQEGEKYFTDSTLKALVNTQTKPVFSAISKTIAWANNLPTNAIQDNQAAITEINIKNAIARVEALIVIYTPKSKNIRQITHSSNLLSLPKPFLLLAGISGTGKTRFVREQADSHGQDLGNYCLIPVRPDWHEPSDLLGYVSRVGKPQYVVTDLLRFVVAAWKNAYVSATADSLAHKDAAQMTPYWLCLDEMNLAPVEQYFSDYLAVLETRRWHDGRYSCDALLKAAAFNTLDDSESGLGKMRADLALAGAEFDGLWAYFLNFGIALPPNLMVAGTVNMDETTHGFSRKVIDRAFTVDFGAFYPNDFGAYFAPTILNKTLGFPCLSAVNLDDLAVVVTDSDGQKSIQFLNGINQILAQTPFELAFRALNELLIALVCFAPKDDAQLQAVWDDFLMTKVLPRIDGDGHKLAQSNTESLLTRLSAVAQQQCTAIWDGSRLDLLRENLDGSRCEVLCRSKAKLAWMQARLVANGFTSFWP